MKGWWRMTDGGIEASMLDDSVVNETSWEHIYSQIKEGYICGELIQEG